MADATRSMYEEFWKPWRDLGVASWSRMAQQTVEADAFTQWMGAGTDWFLAAQKRVRQGMEQSLAALDLPTRDDLARLSAQIASLETRVVECEERLDAREKLDRIAAAQADARASAAPESNPRASAINQRRKSK